MQSKEITLGKDLPLVTVVTPAYNQGKFLKETIESVLAQDYPKIEYIVLNDGSTDDTAKILESYGDAFRWENQPNIGQTPTINKGWRMSSGQIITWLNSDDTFLPGSVTKAVDYLNQNPNVGIVFGDTMLTTADGQHVAPSPPQPPFSYLNFVINCRNTISQPSTFIRRDVIEKVGFLDDHYYYFMDWDLWMRAGLYFEIQHIEDLMSTYRLHDESKTVAQAARAAPELEYMYERYFAREDLPPQMVASKSRALMNMYFTSGSFYLKGGEKFSAARMASKAIKVNPYGRFSADCLRKYAYCRWGDSEVYKLARRLFRPFVKEPLY